MKKIYNLILLISFTIIVTSFIACDKDNDDDDNDDNTPTVEYKFLKVGNILNYTLKADTVEMGSNELEVKSESNGVFMIFMKTQVLIFPADTDTVYMYVQNNSLLTFDEGETKDNGNYIIKEGMKVGDKFIDYNPNDTMYREVVALDVDVATSLGTFKGHKLKETESGSSPNDYTNLYVSPDVGLIKMEMVENDTVRAYFDLISKNF